MIKSTFQKKYQSFRTKDIAVAEIHETYVNENAKDFEVRIVQFGDEYCLMLTEAHDYLKLLGVLDE